MNYKPLFLSALLLASLAACDRDHRDRIYTSRDTDECSRLRFACVPGQVPFSDDTGCGCELTDEELLKKQRINGDTAPVSPTVPTYPTEDNERERYDADDEIRTQDDPVEQNLDKQQNERLDRD